MVIYFVYVESQQNSQNLSVDLQQLHNSKLPESYQQEFDSQQDCFKIKNFDSDRRFIAQFLSHLVSDANPNQTIIFYSFFDDCIL
jgi:hypothetical protein